MKVKVQFDDGPYTPNLRGYTHQITPPFTHVGTRQCTVRGARPPRCHAQWATCCVATRGRSRAPRSPCPSHTASVLKAASKYSLTRTRHVCFAGTSAPHSATRFCFHRDQAHRSVVSFLDANGTCASSCSFLCIVAAQ